uniref:Uncharacterized protein n=1 Tax=Caenorhabditis japonica TaxID=281687 RepID=A0A8R1HLL1_CAEJA
MSPNVVAIVQPLFFLPTTGHGSASLPGSNGLTAKPRAVAAATGSFHSFDMGSGLPGPQKGLWDASKQDVSKLGRFKTGTLQNWDDSKPATSKLGRFKTLSAIVRHGVRLGDTRTHAH